MIAQLAAAQRLLCVAGMLNMSIRRKLFLAFALVAAISSAALLLLAASYIRTARAQLDAKFVDDARAALHRQEEHAARTEERTFDVLAAIAAQADALKPASASETQSSDWFERAPALIQIAIWDSQKQEVVRTLVRPGAHAFLLENIDKNALAAELRNPPGHTTRSAIIFLAQNGPLYHVATIGSGDAPRGYVIGEEDVSRLATEITFAHEGRALLFDLKSGQPWMAADAVVHARAALPGLDRLLTQRPSNGEAADVDDGDGRRYRVYSAVSAETPFLLFKDNLEAIVVEPVDELYAPLAQIRLRVLVSVGITVVLAFLAAFVMSGRFVADIERIRAAVAAFAQGDWRRLEKSSRDELGGSLVDSVNEMATAVAERMRRDEAESWRSLVRVVSHEINNTLAPIRSVAASMRTGLTKRLRDNDAGADVDMALTLIVERVDALATFIDGYAEVAKLPQPDRRLTDVGRLVAGATALFAEEAERHGVSLDLRAAGVGAAEVDAQQIERVLVNLVKNAVEASPRGSAVDVIAARVAGGLEILVADAGPGISPDARRNLFVPYFTTKPGGSGVGLALARQIVVAHGGTITAERSPSGGTLMRVLLPDVAHGHPYREVG